MFVWHLTVLLSKSKHGRLGSLNPAHLLPHLPVKQEFILIIGAKTRFSRKNSPDSDRLNVLNVMKMCRGESKTLLIEVINVRAIRCFRLKLREIPWGMRLTCRYYLALQAKALSLTTHHGDYKKKKKGSLTTLQQLPFLLLFVGACGLSSLPAPPQQRVDYIWPIH